MQSVKPWVLLIELENLKWEEVVNCEQGLPVEAACLPADAWGNGTSGGDRRKFWYSAEEANYVLHCRMQ